MNKLTILIALFALSTSAFPQEIIKDLELSNQLLALAEYGAKSSWSVSELNNLESLVNEFTDEDLKQLAIVNIITYALLSELPNQPPSSHCEIAKRNISRLKDGVLRSLSDMNYNISAC